MANFVPAPVFSGSDTTTRAVWVVVDPRDVVTGGRVPVPLEVRLKNDNDEPIAAVPIAARSGVYCFLDLNLAAGNYTVQVEPPKNDRSRYLDAEQEFPLVPVPTAAQPLNRNLVTVQLLPKSSYPFDAQATLARGRLIKASDKTPIENAQIFLTLDTVNKGLWQRTDESGQFVIFFPRTEPGTEAADTLKEFKFTLRFEIPGHSHTTSEQTVKEGTTNSLSTIEFPGT